jgi:hypothetical protein
MNCIDCGLDTATAGECYMVHSRLWLAAGMEPWGGYLCVGCLEARLRRKLEPGDFTDSLLNRLSASPRLMSRRR